MNFEGIIKKKEIVIEDLKLEIKTQKKIYKKRRKILKI
jgi:hypothetical protein